MTLHFIADQEYYVWDYYLIFNIQNTNLNEELIFLQISKTADFLSA